jgi:hypothetical protein
MIRNLFRPRHLLDPWRDRFVTDLRLHHVSGSRIGDALAQVDAHCMDSGEEPEQAFGDPVTYATHVAEQVRPGDLTASESPLHAGLLALGVLLGVQTLLSGVAGLVSGVPAELSLGSLVGAAIGTAGMAVLVWFASVLQGPRRRGLWFAGIWLVLGAMSLPPNIWTSTAVELDAWLSVGVALVLLGATWASPWATMPDQVVDPLTGRDSMPTPRWLVLGIRWLLPVSLAGAVVLILFVPMN